MAACVRFKVAIKVPIEYSVVLFDVARWVKSLKATALMLTCIPTKRGKEVRRGGNRYGDTAMREGRSFDAFGVVDDSLRCLGGDPGFVFM